MIRRVIACAVLFLLGWLLGPAIFCAGEAVETARAGRPAELGEAWALVDAVDDRNRRLGFVDGDFDQDISDCGYEKDKLFGPTPELYDPRQNDRWSPYDGYFYLLMWRNHVGDRNRHAARAEYLLRRLGGLEVSLLNHCLRETIFAGLCDSRARNALAKDGALDPLFSPNGYTPPPLIRQTETICAYLDGVAARRGLPISRRKPETGKKA